ncbi:hypothetical protein QQF64_028011 [Cirrhinus molitorella]|uniref:Uncharacterized protein n=1 Tax=Cirrhinus molitorella TaxID=172907 RepID=A0ABR3NEC3_9TELE
MYMGVNLCLLNLTITLPSEVITEGVVSITDHQLQHPKAEKKRFPCVCIYCGQNDVLCCLCNLFPVGSCFCPDFPSAYSLCE